MPENLPYLVSPGTVATALQKIRAAATPARFTQDFLANTLGMKRGSPKPIIPFLKRIGFLGTDAAPTDLYKAFRNTGQSGAAVAQAMRIGYKPLFDMNVRAHDLADSELKGLVVQATVSRSPSLVQLLTWAPTPVAPLRGSRPTATPHTPTAPDRPKKNAVSFRCSRAANPPGLAWLRQGPATSGC